MHCNIHTWAGIPTGARSDIHTNFRVDLRTEASHGTRPIPHTEAYTAGQGDISSHTRDPRANTRADTAVEVRVNTCSEAHTSR
jgi:hypothetical protein